MIMYVYIYMHIRVLWIYVFQCHIRYTLQPMTVRFPVLQHFQNTWSRTQRILSSACLKEMPLA